MSINVEIREFILIKFKSRSSRDRWGRRWIMAMSPSITDLHDQINLLRVVRLCHGMLSQLNRHFSSGTFETCLVKKFNPLEKELRPRSRPARSSNSREIVLWLTKLRFRRLLSKMSSYSWILSSNPKIASD